MNVPARGTMLWDMAVLGVRQRQLGRAILKDTPIGAGKAWLEGPGWWFFYAYGFVSMLLAWLLDPGLALFVAIIVLWGVWKRRTPPHET